MSVKAETLRGLHRIHRQLTDLRSRLDRGPKQLMAHNSSVERLRESLAAAKETFKRNRITIDQKELNLKERESRILGVQGKLNAANSNREYQAFLEQIAADEEANSVLSDEILELFDKATELEDIVKTAEESLNKGLTDLETVKNKIENERSGLEAEVQRLEGELAELEKLLPTDLRNDYLRIVKSRGEEGLAEVDGTTCGSCYTTITTQMLDEINMEKLVFCKSCGCILYKSESKSHD